MELKLNKIYRIKRETTFKINQDKIYGEGKRLFNVGGSKSQRRFKCTVCGATK